MSHEEMRIKGEELIRRIPGTRRQADEPAYIHSQRVAAALERQGFSQEAIIGGLLHDVVEDSETTFEELAELGFSERVIQLVRLCSHDETIEGSDSRWIKMMANLVDANDREAWAIKLVDITDNLATCHLLYADRCKMMKEAKAPLMLSLTRSLLGAERVWKELEERTQEVTR